MSMVITEAKTYLAENRVTNREDILAAIDLLIPESRDSPFIGIGRSGSIGIGRSPLMHRKVSDDMLIRIVELVKGV